MSAKWDDNSHNVFLDLCEDEIRKGNRPNTHFSKNGWNNLETAFNERTGNKWSKKQLKNHWDQMKKEWTLFKSLMRGESGLGWDASKNTIDADADWWAAKIAMNKEYKKFQGKDLSLFWFRYDALFTDFAATGAHAVASTQIESDDIDINYNDGLFNVPTQQEDAASTGEKSDDNINLSFEASSLQKKRKRIETKDSAAAARKSMSGATSLKQNISDLVEIMKSSRSTATSSKGPEAPTIKECIDLLHSFPPGSLPLEVTYWASGWFMKKEAREVFMGQPNDENRIGMLKYLFQHTK